MFESVKQEERLNAMTYCASLLVSLIVHAAILCAIVVVPLVFANTLPLDPIISFVIDPPNPPVPPPPPAPPAKSAAAPKRDVILAPLKSVPDRIPAGIPPTEDAPVDIGIDRVIQPIGDSAHSTAAFATALESLIESAPEFPPPPPPPKRIPVPVGGNLQESKLIYRVDPVYPELALRAHVSGSVVLEAVVDEEGNVANLKVLSGHPILVAAAVEAVKQWKYSPTVLNGEPVPVLATVTVVFRFR
jgi:protein TonB